ncbi:hypothetical protein [Lentzea albida]|uniref:PLL-like beta propeller domain-containing protein n=1 Tax=Lentzea albida TaxID=65499 RepID=A0A1H9ADF2_9PSEU|nr:hypothetical protein [Lentzea albida]SEP74724.1 hypothetical protein SAMN04488000_101120 [Lentzea albida]
MDIRTTAVATTAIFAAILGAQAPATAAEQSGDPLILLSCSTYSTNKSVTRSEVIARAQSWIDAGVTYNQGGCYTNRYGDYRMDCSGMTSMAWGLSSSRTTYTLDQVSHVIPRSELKPGDALNKYDEHVAIFAGWADAARTQPIVLNHGGDPVYAHRTVWSAAFAARFTPIRYDNIVDDVTVAGNEAPAVVVEGNGAMQVFARDTNTGKLVTSWQSGAGSGWSGWTALPTNAVGTPSAHVDGLGQMNVFTRRDDGHLIHLWQDGPDGAIDRGADLGGDFAGDPVVITKADGAKVVFLRGTDGRLWHKWQTGPGSAFSDSALVRDDFGTIIGKPSVQVDAEGRFTVFAVRSDNHLITAWQTEPGGAFTTADLGGAFAGDPVAISKANGAKVVFVRGTDGQLWHKWQTSPGSAFSDSALVRGDLGQVLGAPAVQLSGDAMQVFVRRADGHMVTAWQHTAGENFAGIDDIGGNLASDPVIGRQANGAKAAYARFTDGSVMTTWQDDAGGAFRKTWSYLSS